MTNRRPLCGITRIASGALALVICLIFLALPAWGEAYSASALTEVVSRNSIADKPVASGGFRIETEKQLQVRSNAFEDFKFSSLFYVFNENIKPTAAFYAAKPRAFSGEVTLCVKMGQYANRLIENRLKEQLSCSFFSIIIGGNEQYNHELLAGVLVPEATGELADPQVYRYDQTSGALEHVGAAAYIDGSTTATKAEKVSFVRKGLEVSDWVIAVGDIVFWGEQCLNFKITSGGTYIITDGLIAPRP